MQGGLAAAGGTAVHHVVMDESECVEELERSAGVEELRLVTRRAAGQRTPVAEGGAEPLATGRNEAVERGEEL